MVTDAALALPLPDEATLRPYREAAASMLAAARALAIADDEALGRAVQQLADVVRANRAGEQRRVEAVKPLNDHVKRVNELFREVMGPVAEAERLVKGKIGEYQAARRREAEQAARRAEEERQQRETEAARAQGVARKAVDAIPEALTLPEFFERTDAAARAGEAAAAAVAKAAEPVALIAPPAATVAVDGAAATVRQRWDFRVEDMAKVPRAFLALDETAVREAIRNGVREIPGLRIEPVPEVSVRTAPPAPRAATPVQDRYGW